MTPHSTHHFDPTGPWGHYCVGCGEFSGSLHANIEAPCPKTKAAYVPPVASDAPEAIPIAKPDFDWFHSTHF